MAIQEVDGPQYDNMRSYFTNNVNRPMENASLLTVFGLKLKNASAKNVSCEPLLGQEIMEPVRIRNRLHTIS